MGKLAMDTRKPTDWRYLEHKENMCLLV